MAIPDSVWLLNTWLLNYNCWTYFSLCSCNKGKFKCGNWYYVPFSEIIDCVNLCFQPYILWNLNQDHIFIYLFLAKRTRKMRWSISNENWLSQLKYAIPMQNIFPVCSFLHWFYIKMILFGIFELNEIHTSLFLHFQFGWGNILNYACDLYHTSIGQWYPRDKFGAYSEGILGNFCSQLSAKVSLFPMALTLSRCWQDNIRVTCKAPTSSIRNRSVTTYWYLYLKA